MLEIQISVKVGRHRKKVVNWPAAEFTSYLPMTMLLLDSVNFYAILRNMKIQGSQIWISMQARTLKNVIKKIESWGKIVLPTKNYGKHSTLNVSYTTHIYSYIMRIL